MKPRQAHIGNRPFANLKDRLAAKKIHLPVCALPEPASRPPTPAEEKALFDAAMADVVPLAHKGRAVPGVPTPRRGTRREEHPDAETLRRLKRLVETGEGFVLNQTAEYVEGASTWVAPEIFRRLHGGYFSIQGHVDLHGMDVATARAAFDGFMKSSLATGKRAVLVVHGRGRCSPGPPVLKRQLYGWLTRAPWKRWVIAFTSARTCDGGTGATYVLLRSHPASGKPASPAIQPWPDS
jgi:DNA-nicking Smr family endonuclease